MGFRVGAVRRAGTVGQLLLARILRLDARGLAPLAVTGFCVGLAVLAGAAALLLRRVKDFAKRGTACILLCGTLFVFANPPMQTPDETDHYLRTYAFLWGTLTLTPSAATPRT